MSKIGTGIAAFLILGAIGTINQSCDDTNPAPRSPIGVITDNTVADTYSPEIQDLTLESTWDSTSAYEQGVICQSIATFGIDWALDKFRTGSGGTFDDTRVANFFTEKC